MRASALALLATALAAAPARAQDVPAGAFSIGGGATLTSDYRFRGLSRSNKRIAAQGTATVSHESGLYAGAWASTIDDYVQNGSDAEVDLYGGYRRSFGGTTIDAGLLYYLFPGAGSLPDGAGTKSDFFEPYLKASHTLGPVTARVGGNFAWRQHGLGIPNDGRDRSAGAYGYGELAVAIPATAFTVTGHLGHSFVRNQITLGDRYTDWGVTAAYVWKAFTVSASYVDTDRDAFSYPAGGGRNRDISDGRLVGAVSVGF